MSRPRLWLLIAVMAVAVLVTALLVRYALYPLVADRLPFDKEKDAEEIPDPALPFDPVAEIESIYSVHFVDVGQGDAMVIQTPSKNVLIDGGTRNSGLTEYLTRLAIDTLHLLISTHPHADHIGGLPDVLRKFPVLEVIDPAVPHTTRLFTTYLELIDSLDIRFTAGRKGMQRSLGDRAMLELLHPEEPSEKHLNDASLVCRVVLDQFSLLLSGDIEVPSELSLLAGAMSLRSHVLKVAHHGSATSSSEGFLDAVQPEVAVIFCGHDNVYEFPHPETLHKLYMRNIHAYRTDKSGTVVIHTDGDNYYIVTEHGGVDQAPGPGDYPLAKINLNTASLEELIRIVHIGPARAQQLIEMRPIDSMEDLVGIPGIDQNRLDDIKKQNLAYI